METQAAKHRERAPPKPMLRSTLGAELGLEPRLGNNSSPAKSHLVDQGAPAEAQSPI